MPLNLGSLRLGLNGGTPLWRRLIRDAEAAAAAAGASLWYVPPNGYAPRTVNGPFVNSNGTGGVPTVGSGVVGWLRDRQNPTLGSEMLTNGDFASGSTGWTVDTGVTISGGRASFSGVTHDAGIRQAASFIGGGTGFVSGRTYVVEFTISNYVSGEYKMKWPFDGPTAVGNGLYRCIGVATDSRFAIISWLSSCTFDVDNVSVREIPGNHATQSTSANRPVLVAAPGAAAAADGFAALSLDGSNDFFAVPASRWREVGWSLGASLTAPSARNWRALANSQQGFGYSTSSGAAQLRGTEFGVADYVTSVTPSGAHVVSVIVTDASPTPYEFRLNGTSVATVNGAGASTNSMTNASLFATAGGSEILQGVVGAAWALPSTAPAMTTSQRQAIERLGAYIVGATYTG